jgi:hypothetical protein
LDFTVNFLQLSQRSSPTGSEALPTHFFVLESWTCQIEGSIMPSLERRRVGFALAIIMPFSATMVQYLTTKPHFSRHIFILGQDPIHQVTLLVRTSAPASLQKIYITISP